MAQRDWDLTLLPAGQVTGGWLLYLLMLKEETTGRIFVRGVRLVSNGFGSHHSQVFQRSNCNEGLDPTHIHTHTHIRHGLNAF